MPTKITRVVVEPVSCCGTWELVVTTSEYVSDMGDDWALKEALWDFGCSDLACFADGPIELENESVGDLLLESVGYLLGGVQS